MRFQPALASALVSSATLMGFVHAEDAEAAAEGTPVGIERPTFTVRLQEATRLPATWSFRALGLTS